MTRQSDSGWTITCDICRDGWMYEDPPIFPSLEAALREAEGYGWTLTDRDVCPECSKMLACGLVGHVWEPWQEAGPYLRSDETVWRGRVRYCLVCTAGEWNPPIAFRRPEQDRRS